MSILTDLATAAGGLLCVAGGAGLIYLFGRDPKADEHDLWSSTDVDAAPVVAEPGIVWHDLAAKERHDRRHEPTPGQRAAWPLVDRKPMPPRPALRPARAVTGPVGLAAWQPAASADGPVPPLARALLIAQAVPTLPDAAVRGIADEWLREIAAEQQARAGVRPVVSPATDRDLTGAFAVVAVA